jgi:hypothetical protein
MKQTALALLVLSVLASPAWADTQEELTKLYTDTNASEIPNMTFFKGLAAMGDFDAGPETMNAVQAAAQIPQEGLLGAFLSNIERITKRGDRVTLVRSKGVDVSLDGGFVKLSNTITFRLRTKSNEAKIDKVEGARVGEKKSKTYPLRSVRFERKDPKTFAHINAGYGMGLNKTKTVVAIDTTPREGIAQAVSN